MAGGDAGAHDVLVRSAAPAGLLLSTRVQLVWTSWILVHMMYFGTPAVTLVTLNAAARYVV